MIDDSRCCLVVFAREPAFEQVKQRLAADVGATSALSIYQRLLDRTLRLARSVQRHGLRDPAGVHNRVRLVVAASRHDQVDDYQRLAAFCVYTGAEFVQQRGNNLGSRMHHAIQDAAQHDTDRIVLIGSDCPDLQRADLAAAFDALARRDVCFVPTADGGYCLIGMRGVAPDVFEGIAWGQSMVARQTQQRCHDLDLSVAALRQKQDVDYLSDWSQWCARQRARSLPEHAWEDAGGETR